MATTGAWRPRAGVDLALVVLLGALQSLPFVWLPLWPLQFVLVALLVWRVACASGGRAMLLGMGFGTAWVAAGTWWLYISMHRYGGLPALLTVLAVVGLALFLSLYLGLAMALFARWRRGAAWRQALLFGALWLLAELARGVIFTGFPWLASGYAHVDSPLGGLAPWVGVYGIGFVVATLAAWLALRGVAFSDAYRRLASMGISGVGDLNGEPGYDALGSTSVSAGLSDVTQPTVVNIVEPRAGLTRGLRSMAQAMLFVVTVLAGGALLGRVDFTAPTGTLSVSLLQGNVPQEEKFEADNVPVALAWTAAAVQRSQGELVVGPETVIPVLLTQLDPEFWRDLTLPFTRGDRAALLGAPLGDMETGYTNSALGVSKATASTIGAAQPAGYYRYDKHHLVPFGEFVPEGFHWFTQMMNIPLGDFNRGAVVQPSFVVKGERVAPNICYEDLFGEELAARFVDATLAPTILANISNIGWFGDSIAVGQHLQISRMRTLELQRPMLRATNTGATVVIDHRAVVTASLVPYTQGVLEARVEGRSGITPFAWWAGRFDLWPLWLLAIALVGLMGGWRRLPRPAAMPH